MKARAEGERNDLMQIGFDASRVTAARFQSTRALVSLTRAARTEQEGRSPQALH